MKLHARAFYTAHALGIAEKMNAVIFSEMNVKKNRLKNEEAIAKLFVKNGVDKGKFSKTFNSFGVTSQVGLAESRANSYRVKGTPEIIVNGKYRVSSTMVGSQANMLKVADFLIAEERKKLGK